MKAIVTVRLPRDSQHDPRNKKTGKCPLFSKKVLCTDVAGSHHSYIEFGKDRKEIEKKARARFGHITRIEDLDDWLNGVADKIQEKGCPMKTICYSYNPEHYCCTLDDPSSSCSVLYPTFLEKEKMIPVSGILTLLVEAKGDAET